MSKPYLITYTDGSKRHCNRRELDSLRPHVKPIGDRKYLCTIPCHTVRMTATENTLATLALAPAVSLDRWPGPDVVIEMDGKRYRECGLENPVTMLARLQCVVPTPTNAPDCRG
jgi:hypothetical protein